MNIINDPYATLGSGLAHDIGGGLATGLSAGLQQLGQMKLNQLMQRQQARQAAGGLQALGIPQAEAAKISMMPVELQSSVVKNYLASAENAGLNQALANLSGQPQEQMQPLMQAVGLQQPKNIQQPQVSTEKQPQLPEAQAMQNRQAVQQQAPQKQGMNFAELLKNPRLKPEQKLRIQQLQMQKEQFERKMTASERREQEKKQAAIDKETHKAYSDIVEGSKTATDNNRRLGRMEELVNRGKLTIPLWHSILDTVSNGVFGVGLDVHSLESADSQEFNKLSKEFLKDAKPIFGARITDTDVRQFLQMVPTLSQSDEGKRRIINNMKAYNFASQARKRAMDQVIKENHGKRPQDLQSRVEEKVAPTLDLLANEFKKGIGTNKKESTGIMSLLFPYLYDFQAFSQ